MRFWFTYILLILIAGCSSTAMYKADKSLNAENSAVVYIYRTDVAYNSLNPEKPFFFLDDKLVAKLGTGQYKRFYVSPGNHSVSSKESFLFNPSSESGKVTGNFKAGKTYYFRYSKDFSNIYGTDLGFVMTDRSSLRLATEKSFKEKS